MKFDGSQVLDLIGITISRTPVIRNTQPRILKLLKTVG